MKIHSTSVLGSQVIVEPGATIGPGCILEGCTRIGAGTILVAGVKLFGDTEIGTNCDLEANVSTSGPAAEVAHRAGPLIVGAGSHVGAGAVLTTGVRIGVNAWIEAGSVVFRDVPAHAIVRGNPGTVIGFHGPSSRAADLIDVIVDPKAAGVVDCNVAGVKLYRFPRITDRRGSLSFGEFGRNIPFIPHRYFLVFDVPYDELRGGHAHATCQELIFCISGSVAVVIDDGRVREEIVLDSPDLGLFLPGRVWGMQYKYSPGAVLVVLASHHFDPQDYIHRYDDFIAENERQRIKACLGDTPSGADGATGDRQDWSVAKPISPSR